MGASQTKNFIIDENNKEYNLKQNIEAFRRWFSKFPVVSGPVGFTFFPNVGGRAFFIFEDIHEKGFECEEGQGGTPIENVLGTIWALEEPDSPTFSAQQRIHDFFFEHTFICSDDGNFGDDGGDDGTCVPVAWTNEKYSGTSIGNVNVKFSECFSSKDKKACFDKYPLTRFHYIDYRFSYLPSGGRTLSTKTTKIFKSILHSFSGAYTERFSSSSSSTVVTFDFGDVLTFFSPLLLGGGFLRAYVENFFNEAFSNDDVLKEFIKKEIKNRLPYTIGAFFLLNYTAEFNVTGFRRRILRNVKESTRGKEIEAWVLSIVKDHVVSYEKIMKSPFGGGGDTTETVEEKITRLVSEVREKKTVEIPLETFERLSLFSRKSENELVAIAGRLELDAPTIGRMFKPSIVETGSKYVWFYGGRRHAQSIEGFLEFITLGNEQEESKYKSTSSLSKRCIRVPIV